MINIFRRPLLLAILLCALVSTGWSLEHIKGSLPLPLGGTVIVDTYRGSINVVPGEGRDVLVSVSIFSGRDDSDDELRALEHLQLSIDRVDENVVVTARNPYETGVKFIWEDQRKLSMQITLTVPQECNLDLFTNDGGITVGSLRGKMKARTETGTIFFRNIDGSVDAWARSGDVVVSRCTGSVDLRSGLGNVRIGMVGGHARLETVSGNIELQTARGAVEALASEGDIDAGFAVISAQSKIHTKVGNINATVNPSESFSIEAKARWGKVHNALALHANRGGDGRRYLQGDYNGGGPLIELRAGGGSVNIGSDPYFE